VANALTALRIYYKSSRPDSAQCFSTIAYFEDSPGVAELRGNISQLSDEAKLVAVLC
jgi:hypothetical protein